SQPPFSLPGLWSGRFTPVTLHWFVLAVVTLSYLGLRRITQSPFGMVLQSIRENEARTRAIGYHVERYKIVAVMLSGLFAGLAGVLYAIQNKFAAPDFVLFLDWRALGGDHRPASPTGPRATGSSATSGRTTVKTVPPARPLRKTSVPPCSSTILCASARPIPVPPSCVV